MDPIQTATSILGRTVVAGAMDMLTNDLNIRLRVREMEKVFTAPAAIAITLPPDYAEAVLVELDDRPLLPATIGNLSDGTFAMVANELRMTADSGLLRMTYRGRLAPVSQGQSNDVLDAYPSLYLYGLLRHHATLTRDDAGQQHWTPMFEGALTATHEADTRARQSEIAMRPIPAYRP